MLLQGIFPPITTPFYPDGRVYFRKLEHNVDRYSRTPIAGMVVLGSTGEAIMLSDDERRDVLKEARAAAAPDKVLIAGAGAESVIETLRLTEYAATLGYDVALIRTPHFYRAEMKPESLLAFYRTVADRSPLPVLIYNVPPLTAYDIPVEVVTALAEHTNIIGMKESSRDQEKLTRIIAGTRRVHRQVTVSETFTPVTGRMLAQREEKPQGFVAASTLGGGTAAAVEAPAKFKTRTKDAGFQVLTGTADKLLDALNAGASGAVIAFSGAAPTACFEIFTAWKDRDPELAAEKQQRIVPAVKQVHVAYGIAGLKYAMDLNGYYGGPPRLPLLPLTADAKAEIEKAMANVPN